jgi:shikimate dehydrogenase
MSNPLPSRVKLGLIGDNISRSQAPRLHVTAGQLTGLEVSYDRLVPRDMAMEFDAVFDHASKMGFRGINVTYPYKERAAAKVQVDDPLVKAIGAVNTVIFTEAGPKGYNTDYSGFVFAYRSVRGEKVPGVVCLIGTGGVGKAVAFALVALGASVIRCVDLDLAKAKALAASVRELNSDSKVEVFTDPLAAANGADGLINCTPVGMVGYEGTPLPAAAMTGAQWAFDAVYTPVDTQFLKGAASAGLTVISGYELFFGQGVDAWQIFTEEPLDHAALRQAIAGDNP